MSPTPGSVRITDLPPEPPFDTCTMSDGSAYNAAAVAFARPSRQSREGWICPEPAPMGLSETADYTFVSPACYPDAEYVPPLLEGRPGYGFLGAPVAAERVAYASAHHPDRRRQRGVLDVQPDLPAADTP